MRETKDLEPGAIKKILDWAEEVRGGDPFLFNMEGIFLSRQIFNLWASQCFSCEKIAIWIHDKLVFPDYQIEINPNRDLPEEIKADFIEAARISDVSPRGSAAILRLCIQKICQHLGGKGNNINDDIGDFVRRGLDVRVQKALDIVRVIGNNAVHPGQIDLRDDRETVSKLFRLVNMIADAMITQPKHVAELYEELPDGFKRQIEKRDARRT
jgi:hypothetical protein